MRKTLREVFDSKWIPEPFSGCWLWMFGTNKQGYGTISDHRFPRGAHRVSYELNVGSISGGKQIHHLCHTKRCVNPDHLRIVSSDEHNEIDNTFAYVNGKKTRCVHGHPFNEKNTYVRKRGRRGCRVCNSVAAKKYKQKKAA